MEAVLEWIERGRDELDRDIRRAMASLWVKGAVALTPLESGDMLCRAKEFLK
jgi:hypothetical protein